jgi:hypothetical protein
MLIRLPRLRSTDVNETHPSELDSAWAALAKEVVASKPLACTIFDEI